LNYRPTFIKNERISIQKEIDLLFNEGASFGVYPLHIVYVEKKPVSGLPASILISVPKKRFKKAVSRNRIKRLIRESYRLNKKEFWEFLCTKDKGLLIAFIYVGNELCEYKKIEASLIKALNELKGKLQ
jgi:ribonuclease P protein component